MRQVTVLFWHKDCGRVKVTADYHRTRPAEEIAAHMVRQAIFELGLPNAWGVVCQGGWERPA